MNFNVATLEALQAEGLDLAACIRVLRTAEPKVDTAAEKRRAYDRQRKAEKRAESSDMSGGKSGGNPPDPAPNEIDILTPTRKTSEPNGSSSKNGICFPADWVVPSPDDLTPKAKACGKLWTKDSYETEAEGFALYWRQSRKRRPDWTATWCAWVIRQHSKVMRDQKFGNAPVSIVKTEKTPEELRDLAQWYDTVGRRDDAAECRRKAAERELRAA